MAGLLEGVFEAAGDRRGGEREGVGGDRSAIGGDDERDAETDRRATRSTDVVDGEQRRPGLPPLMTIWSDADPIPPSVAFMAILAPEPT